MADPSSTDAIGADELAAPTGDGAPWPARTTARAIRRSWAAERPDLAPSDYLPQIYLLRLARIMDRLDERAVRRDWGMGFSELRVLLALRRQGPPYAMRPTDLFRAVLVTSGAISKQIARLLEAGLVRQRGEGEGRYLVQLTGAGMAAADRALDYVARRSILSPGTCSLTREERETFQMLCEKMLSDVEARLGHDDLA